jgi:isocitrate/isopropylmalate dehydrogenase
MSPSTTSERKRHNIAAIGGDGIGPEVISAGIAVLHCLAETLGSYEVDIKEYNWNSETYKKTGKYIPGGGLDELRKHDAIFFGAVGSPGMFRGRRTG